MTDDDAARTLPIEIERSYTRLRPHLDAFADAALDLIRRLLEAEGISVASVTARTKEPASLRDKYESKQKYRTLEDITDLVGLRVVCFYQSDVARVVDLICREFLVKQIERHGGLSSLETFGYESTHLLASINGPRRSLIEYRTFSDLIAEVQVRTVLQDAWAVISHKLDYKTATAVPVESRRTLFRVAALLETSDDLFDRFRTEVQEVRSEYAEAVADNRNDELALDLDSVRAIWNTVDKNAITELGLSWGMADPTLDDDFETEDALLNRLLGASIRAGFATTGQLLDVANNMPRYAATMRWIAKNGVQEDYFGRGKNFIPYAIPEDMVGWAIAVGKPDVIEYFSKEGIINSIPGAILSAPGPSNVPQTD